ncbi:vesicle-associated membrane protein 7 [Bombus vosnesenskii]|uniref:Vesicle-associated membrane protein 7 n=3 Tax=Pyrobombus TaxID=144703 RepID=A0A6J3KWQ8_9HYME|nr:vesicle-associated membrane protein 7 [Bombus impatiens]XP_012242686.1 vesicle-associated membrane protein 7 [Bombus impatiens]XP_024224372.1 vesicle-associated membrane protein 7 [Bombus impatiens]XP_033188008.1 vesicle-associated membrane protein 7 [Bombus vancouverensis nearcticus]XP_033188009.1 vesicle-associated membrane protein 7 [Bombus vancouverensis nearcticus]XP_033188010.1 vesicle-associated membrane protein 7 [Bombus vancouverensis nearcticus]XP_033302308.1 vesicle-associated m
MPILYTVVARGSTVLAKYASCTGNFDEVTESILAKKAENDKVTYSQGQYLFHYICEDNIIYMCITDDDYQKSKAFLYLAEIKGRFLAAYGQDAQTAIPYAMNTDFARTLASTMKHYNESSHKVDVLDSVLGDLDELKDIMSKNIDNVAMRGERLELLVNKTENLSTNSVTFRKTSRNLARSLFWKNVKIYVIVGVILIVVIYVIVSISCGGLAWPKCVGN